MNLVDLVVLGLAVWRVASLLAEEDGPYAILANLRHAMGVRFDAYSNLVVEPKGPRWYHRLLVEITDQMTCIWCVTVWLGIVATVLYITMPRVTTILALPFSLSTIAIYINGRGIRARKRIG